MERAFPDGDFADPAQGALAAQDAFLRALWEFAPHVVRELRLCVYPEWMCCVPGAVLGHMSEDPRITVEALLQRPLQALPWLESYTEWADRHCLPWDWVAVAVEMSFGAWWLAGVEPDAPIRDDERPHVPKPWGAAGPAFREEFRDRLEEHIRAGGFSAWVPDAETRADAEKRLLTEFKALLRADHEEAEAAAAEMFIRLPKKHAMQKHAEWFVRHHVLGESLNGIANGIGMDRKAITGGVDSMLELLSVTHRPWWMGDEDMPDPMPTPQPTIRRYPASPWGTPPAGEISAIT